MAREIGLWNFDDWSHRWMWKKRPTKRSSEHRSSDHGIGLNYCLYLFLVFFQLTFFQLYPLFLKVCGNFQRYSVILTLYCKIPTCTTGQHMQIFMNLWVSGCRAAPPESTPRSLPPKSRRIFLKIILCQQAHIIQSTWATYQYEVNLHAFFNGR